MEAKIKTSDAEKRKLSEGNDYISMFKPAQFSGNM